MTTLDIVTAVICYTLAGTAAAAGLRAHLNTRRLIATRNRLDAVLDQAAADRAFARWADWTVLTATDAQGYIHASTLRQHYTSGEWDQVWDSPIAVALWHGDPDTVTRFAEEMEREHKRG